MILHKKDLNVLIITASIFFLFILFYFYNHNSFLAYLTVLLNTIFIFKFRKIIPVFIVFIFILLYTITFKYYFVDLVYISYWSDFQNEFYLKRVLLCHFLFLFFFGNFIRTNVISTVFNFRQFFRPRKDLFHIFLLIATLFLIFGIQGKSLLSGASYSDSEIMSKSTLHEYFILFYFFLILYSSDSKYNKFIINLLYLLYVIKTIIYGSRIEVVEISLLYFFIFLLNTTKIKTLIFIFIIGFYSLSVINNIRSNPIGFISGADVGTFFDPTSFIIGKSKGDILATNEGDVLQSSCRILGLVDNNVLSTSQRFYSFLGFLFSPLVPSSLLSEYSNLSTYKQDLYKSGGGGLISVYFYAWLGYLGPILIGCILAFLVNKFFENLSIYYFVYGVSLFVTFPRWFAYNPIMLMKFCLYSVVIVFVYKVVTKNIIRIT